MKLYIRESDNHYFYVMAWEQEDKSSSPAKKKKFDIYDDAMKLYDSLCKKYPFVQIFEYIGGKRKINHEYKKSEETDE